MAPQVAPERGPGVRLATASLTQVKGVDLKVSSGYLRCPSVVLRWHMAKVLSSILPKLILGGVILSALLGFGYARW